MINAFCVLHDSKDITHSNLHLQVYAILGDEFTADVVMAVF